MSLPDKQMILVVDDTPDNLDVLSGILREEYKVKVALNGKRALKIAGSEPQPDLVLLDIMMPEMDGYEVCRQLKSDEATKNIPVIFVTAKTDTDDETEGFAIGAADYIAKPVKPDIVKARVRTQLALAAALKESERLLTENQDMLDKTLVGSVYVISNLLSWANPSAFLRAARLRAFMEGMVEELGVGQDRWQLNLAATLSQIGLVALPAEEMNKYSTGQGVSIKFLSLFKSQAEIGGRALAQVPRLETVSAIIENQLNPLPKKSEYPDEIAERDTYTLGRQLLRIITDFDHNLLGEKSSAALQNMAQNSQYDPFLVETLGVVIQKMEWIPCALSTKNLASGMVVDEDICFPGDSGKISTGTLLNQTKLDQITALFDRNNQYRLFRVKVPFKVDQHGNLPSVQEMQELVAVETEEDTPDNTKRQVDIMVVEPLIKELVDCVKEDDPESKEITSKLQNVVSGTNIAEQVEQIQQFVSQYEFPEALELVYELAGTLKIKVD
jgi:response regulator RpfG family c-di-GMP phosphodiesterase